MKYLIIVGDGMADFPVEDFNGKTPLQTAHHPNMDLIATKGRCGLVKTIPEGTATGSDTANLSLLGYDPRKLKIGRGPLEVASIGVRLDEDDLALRCNLITVEDGVLKDYSAGHISNGEAEKLIKHIDAKLGFPGEREFYSGVSYRNSLVLRGRWYSDRIKCLPPHDHMGTHVRELLIKPSTAAGEATAELLNEMINDSIEILGNHEVNRKRKERGENAANMIWFWGAGRKPKMKTLWEKYHIKSAVISAVDLIKGIGYYTGMEIINVPGATGLYDTNYEGKADYALKSLEQNDLVYLHVEAPDEAGHEGDFQLKVKSIEDLDKRLIGRILNRIEDDYVISVVSDHFTPVKLRTHTADPTPFTIYNSKSYEGDKVKRFDEFEVRKGSHGVIEAQSFLSLVLKG